MKKENLIRFFFRFYNLSEETIQNFINEIMKSDVVIYKVVKTGIIDSHKSSNFGLPLDTKIKEAEFFFYNKEDF